MLPAWKVDRIGARTRANSTLSGRPGGCWSGPRGAFGSSYSPATSKGSTRTGTPRSPGGSTPTGTPRGAGRGRGGRGRPPRAHERRENPPRGARTCSGYPGPPEGARAPGGPLRADGASGVYGPRGPRAREGQRRRGEGQGGRRTREGGRSTPGARGGAVEGVLGPALRRIAKGNIRGHPGAVTAPSCRPRKRALMETPETNPMHLAAGISETPSYKGPQVIGVTPCKGRAPVRWGLQVITFHNGGRGFCVP